MSSILQDLRIAIRGYKKRPLFTVAVLAILGLGIGANSAIFSIVDTVLLRPLDYPHASELVVANQMNRDTGARRPVSPPNYFDLKEQTQTLSAVAAYWSPSISMSGAGLDPEKVLAATCSYELFDVLGIAPFAGRRFLAEDDAAGARPVAVLGDGLWKRRFGGDPRVVGRELTLDGVPTLIVGVMPSGFAFPVAGTELWVPLRLSRTQPPNSAIRPEAYRSYNILSVVARLRPGVTIQQSRSELATIGERLERAHPDANGETTLAIEPLQDTVVGPFRPALLLLMAAVGCVLLIACANVGSLMLIHGAHRAREMTVRMALGAGRARLVRQMLVESVALAIAGGMVGLLVAAWALALMLRLAPAGIPRLELVHIDGAAVAFTFGIAALAGLIFGIAPAYQIRVRRLHDALRSSGRGFVAASSQRARQVLIAGEIALSLMLLVGAVLLIQSFTRMRGVETGFRGSSVLTVDRIELPRGRSSPEASAAFFEGLGARLRAIPGVESAGATLGLPLDPRARFFVDETTFTIAGAPPLPPAQRPAVPIHVVTPDYFATIGVPLTRGRWFTDHDRAAAPGVVIINEAMVRRFWPGENPVGRRITHDLSIVPGQPTTRDIVGVAGDVRHFGLEQPAEPQMFVPHAQMPWPSMAIVIRSPLDAAQLSAAVRQAVRVGDDTIPVPPMRSMDQALADAVGQPRFRAWLLGLFAGMAVLLASTGLYATMAYAAQQRTQEIGLRLALGATPAQATAMLVRRGMTLALAGIAGGLAGSVAVGRALSTMLYGVGATDPLTFVGVAVVFALVAAVACYLPARRARRLDPIAAINAHV